MNYLQLGMLRHPEIKQLTGDHAASQGIQKPGSETRRAGRGSKGHQATYSLILPPVLGPEPNSFQI